ncbi:MAG: DUF2809 domain-containing protein [Candidatus Riflebacteria bacterium]|nr:DUF2809 domain-containing protein [Candidatus Riflebacteria bacterium]
MPFLHSAQNRNRLISVTAMIVAIALGLASRKFPGMFPKALGKYPGDALWSLMVFFCYCICFPRATTFKIAVLALVTSYIVEFSQLYQAPWLNSIRATTFGHLVLGSAFHRLDLLAYAVGVSIGAAFDRIWLAFWPSRL